MNCPKCDREMDRQEYDPDVNVQGGWWCEACDLFIHESEVDTSDELIDPR